VTMPISQKNKKAPILGTRICFRGVLEFWGY
jgi:hypothetical protein